MTLDQLEPKRRVIAVRRLLACASVAIVFSISGARAATEKKVALVFGNAAYISVPRLANPTTDGAAMAAMLQKAGFDVTSKQDATVADMRKMVRDFSAKVSGADEVVVFYAGHGIEVDGTNYLIPVDAKLERDIDVEDEAVSLDRIVRLIEPAKRLRLVILDACRDNPFTPKMKRSLSRGVERGLAKVEPSSPNTLIAYAAKAGSTAADGDGPNGVFTTALLKQLPVAGQDLRKSLGYVRDDVLKMTDNKQEPYVYGSLGGDDVTLVAAAPKPAPVPKQVAALDASSPLRRDYELAAQINTKDGWDAFLRTYPTGFYADLARAARGKLGSPGAGSGASDARNLSISERPNAASTSSDRFEALIGKSYRVTLREKQTEISPNSGRVSHPAREAAIYVKARDDIASRWNWQQRADLPGARRYARAALGRVDKGMQVTYGDGQLLLTMIVSTYRIKVAVTAVGNSCNATVVYELLAGQDSFNMRNMTSGEPMKMSEVTAENVACWVSPEDEVGPPPVAAAKPQ